MLNVAFPTAGTVGSKLLIAQLSPVKDALLATAPVPADSSAFSAFFPAILAPKLLPLTTALPVLLLSFIKTHSPMELVSKN